MKQWIQAAIASPRSSAAGVAILAVTLAFLIGRVSLQEYLGAFGVLSAGGLLAAKDGGR